MILLILADTHNNQQATRQALEIGRKRGAEEAVHCGDLSTPGMVSLFRGWTFQLALGNSDREPLALKYALQAIGNGSGMGPEIHLAMDGLQILALHGHRPDLLTEAIQSGIYDFIFHGHTHRRRDQRFGRTRVVNPGALGSVAMESRSFCLLDTFSRSLEFVELGDTCLSPE